MEDLKFSGLYSPCRFDSCRSHQMRTFKITRPDGKTQTISVMPQMERDLWDFQRFTIEESLAQMVAWDTRFVPGSTIEEIVDDEEASSYHPRRFDLP